MAPKIPAATADTVYQIISGFYPDITSGPRVSGKVMGTKGSTGAKYKLTTGWTDSSIAKAKFEEQKAADPKFAEKEFLRQREENYKGKVTVSLAQRPEMKHKGHEKKGLHKDLERGERTGESIDYFRWTGGSDQFKLFGDMVWYMHAKRNSKDIEDYVKGFGKTAPKFSNIYAKSEANLAKTARSMANEIFTKAVDNVAKILMQDKVDIWNAEQEFSPTGKGDVKAMSPEEMGFTVQIGGTSYMSTPEAAKTHKGVGKIAEGSLAQVRDMVKVVDGKVVEVIDVTEELITKGGQHGIAEGTKELTDLEKVIKKTALDTTDPQAFIPIKEAVVAMFHKNIDKEYNPIIEKLQTYAAKSTKTTKNSFDTILKEIKKNAKKGASKPTASGNLAKAVGIKYRKAMKGKTGKDIFDKSSMAYVAHMLGTVGGLAGADFKQAHRVADYPSDGQYSGQSLYAVIPMEQDPKSLLFLKPPVEQTEVLAGYSATLAMAVNNGEMSSKQALETARGQNQAWQYQRVTRSTEPRAGAAFTNAESGLRASAQHSTSVSAIAGPAFEKVLESIMQLKGPEMAKLTKKIQPIVGDSSYYWNPGQGKKGGSGKRATRLRKGKGRGGTMFWALPYIGIQQSEYTGGE